MALVCCFARCSPKCSVLLLLFGAINFVCAAHSLGADWSVVPVNLIDDMSLFGSTSYARDVWGSGPNDVYIVGGNEVSGIGMAHVWHFDGSNRQLPDVFGAAEDQNLFGVWGSSASDVFIVGGKGAVVHYDGTTWTQMSTPQTSNDLCAVWGTGPDNVYAAGEAGILLHFDGSVWHLVTKLDAEGSHLSTGNTFRGIWGSGPNDIYFVGGVVLHYDGQYSAFLDVPVDDARAVWGTGANDVYVVGGRKVAHFDGSQWSAVTLPQMTFLTSINAVWGTGPNDVYCAGNQVWHYDGSVWTSTEFSATVDNFVALWGSGPSDVWAVNADGAFHRPQPITLSNGQSSGQQSSGTPAVGCGSMGAFGPIAIMAGLFSLRLLGMSVLERKRRARTPGNP